MRNNIMPGIPDKEFVRSNVPMTKEEIRIISLSKLCLNKDSILLDIGAGTGSLSVEAAMMLENGRVLAVERNKEAVEFIKENAARFGVNNIYIIHGVAPDSISDSNFDRVFIGGSGGNLKKIFQYIDGRIPKDGIIVVNAITLETLETSKQYFASHDYTYEIIQVSIARGESAGRSIMMKALNPVFVITGKKK